MPRSRVTIVATLTAIILLSLVSRLIPANPRAVKFKDIPERVTAGQLNLGVAYKLLASLPGSPDPEHNTFLVQDPSTKQMYSLTQADTACDTALWIRPQTLAVSIIPNFKMWGMGKPTYRVLVNPVRRDQILRVPNYPDIDRSPQPNQSKLVVAIMVEPNSGGDDERSSGI